VAIAYAALLLILLVLRPLFFAPANLRDLFVSAAPALVAAVGMTIVILTRQIDISIGSQFAICGVVVGVLAKSGMPMSVAALGAIAAGAVLGGLNGVFVAGFGLPAIVVTLATMVGMREALRWATEGVWVQDLPSQFQWLGLDQNTGRLVIPVLALIVFIAASWSLRHIAAGRAVYATGSNAEAARLVGLRPRRVVFGAFVLMGALTGLAALLSVIQFVDVQTNAGIGLELKVIAAVVVGGTAISGGRGSLAGTLLGVLLLSTTGPALTFLGAAAAWDRALQGLIILVAVAADAVQQRSAS
jgi:rhamnose transport system permease protein